MTEVTNLTKPYATPGEAVRVPAGLLDPAATAAVAELLLDLNRDQGVTMIVVTHNIELARQIGRTCELRNGKLREVGA